MKIIFLDIDGVLNNSPESCQFCLLRDKIDLINQLVSDDVNWVLTTSWRGKIPFYELKTKLLEAGFKGKIVDYTTMMWEDLDGTILHRGDQINLWVKNHRDLIDSFVIIDDSKLKCPDVEGFVIPINPKFGITQEDIDKCKKCLKSEDTKNVP